MDWLDENELHEFLHGIIGELIELHKLKDKQYMFELKGKLINSLYRNYSVINVNIYLYYPNNKKLFSVLINFFNPYRPRHRKFDELEFYLDLMIDSLPLVKEDTKNAK